MTKEITLKEACDEINRLNRVCKALEAQLITAYAEGRQAGEEHSQAELEEARREIEALKAQLAEAEARADAHEQRAEMAGDNCKRALERLAEAEARADAAEKQCERFRGFLASILIQAQDKSKHALSDIAHAAQSALDESAPSPAEAALERMRKALEYYADKGNWWPIPSGANEPCAMWDKNEDGWTVARAALRGTELDESAPSPAEAKLEAMRKALEEIHIGLQFWLERYGDREGRIVDLLKSISEQLEPAAALRGTEAGENVPTTIEQVEAEELRQSEEAEPIPASLPTAEDVLQRMAK